VVKITLDRTPVSTITGRVVRLRWSKVSMPSRFWIKPV
jgi:hypothetical protein